MLGGCQSLHTNSFDEALGLPTQEAATLALRTQQVVAHESGVADFVDAFGGSYAVETLTKRIEDEATVVEVLELEAPYAQGHLFGAPRAIKETRCPPRAR